VLRAIRLTSCVLSPQCRVVTARARFCTHPADVEATATRVLRNATAELQAVADSDAAKAVDPSTGFSEASMALWNQFTALVVHPSLYVLTQYGNVLGLEPESGTPGSPRVMYAK